MTYDSGISIVVVNYRTSWDLARFLRSLEAHPPTVPWSLAIMNVDPNPDDKEVAEDWAADHSNATVVSFMENVGYARATNRGAQLSSHEVIAIFNADVRISAESLDTCFEALLSDPLWGVLGPRQVNDEGLLTAAGIFGGNSRPAHRGWLERDRGQYRDIRDDATSVAGSAYFIRREAWDLLRNCPIYTQFAPDAEGAFLPTRLWYEETWASVHARAHGYAVTYLGTVTMIHRLSQSVKKNPPPRSRMEESHEIFRAMCQAHGLDHD